MERYRLKNIIIFILVLVNVALLGALSYRKASEFTLLRRTEEELITLFAADDIQLPRSAISRELPPSAQTLSRSTQQERTFAHFLLGEDATETVQGGITTFESSVGTLQFRSGGSFEGRIRLSGDDAFYRTLCKTFSFSEPVFTLDEHGTGTALAHCIYQEKEVYNAPLTLTFSEGTLLGLSGTLLSGEGTAAGGNETLSCAAALIAFQKMRRSEGTVGSSVLSTSLCYELQTSPTLSLVSAWRIVTDISSYYVNCSTGAITVA